MKKKLLISTLTLFSISSAICFADVVLQVENKNEVNIEKEPKTISGSLLIKDDVTLQTLIDTQKKKDLADLEILWQGTIANNQVIEFALKKLASPDSQRRIHSSFMAKTLSAVISGASFVPCVMGTNPTVQTAAFSAGRLAQSLVNKKNVPQEVPLTDTELIQLASLVEELQDKIISSYYNYKNTLNQLKATRAKMILYSKNYSKAIQSDDLLDISLSSSLYDNMFIQEYKLEQAAKKYHTELQRLAGKTAVDKLELYQYDFNTALFKGGE